MGAEVVSLFGLLGLKVDQAAWNRGQQQIDSIRAALAGIGAYVSGRFFAKAFVGFSASAEEAVLQIKTMLALARKTDLADQAADAEKMYASLQKRAASLPGTVDEYVGMASKITRVGIAAGLSLQEIEDMAVNGVIAAKGLGEQWEVAARDIEQAIMGRFNTTDPFSAKVLGSIGYVGDAGREKYKGKTEKERAREYLRGLTQKQFTQSGEEFGQTLGGRMDQFKESIKQTLGRVGKPLFEMTKNLLGQISEWIDKNKKQIEEVADVVGGALKKAFTAFGEAVVGAYEFLTSGTEKSKLVLLALAAVGVNILLPTIIGIGAAVKAAFGPWGVLIVSVAALLSKLAEALGFSSTIEMLGAAFQKFAGPAKDVMNGLVVLVRDLSDAWYTVGDAIDEYLIKMVRLVDADRARVLETNLKGEQSMRKWRADPANRAALEQWKKDNPEITMKKSQSAAIDGLFGPLPSVPVGGVGANGVTNNASTVHNVTINVTAGEGADAIAAKVKKEIAQKLANDRLPGSQR